MKGCMKEIPHLCIPEDNPVLDIFRIHSTELWKRTKKKKKEKTDNTNETRSWHRKCDLILLPW